MSSLPKIISVRFKDVIQILLSLSQDRTCFQETDEILQRKSECSMDSGSGSGVKPKRNNFSLVKTVLLRILY